MTPTKFNLEDTIGKDISEIMISYLFEPNNNETRSAVSAAMNEYLRKKMDSGEIYDFVVLCDEHNNDKPSELVAEVSVRFSKEDKFTSVRIKVLAGPEEQ